MTVAQPARGPASRRGLGLAGSALAAACAAGIGLIAWRAGSADPVAEVPSAAMLFAILATPAVIGGVGAMFDRPVLLGAAGVLDLLLSVLAFSGVTLVLLLPAIVLLRASAANGPPTVDARTWPLRWLALAGLAVPVALAIVLTTGIVGVLLLTLLAAVPALFGRARGRRVRATEAIVGAVVVGLVVAAVVANFALTQTICWTARETPNGVVYERVPVSDGPVAVGGVDGIGASGCSSGRPTIEGAAVTMVLLVGAVALSASLGLARPRTPPATAS